MKQRFYSWICLLMTLMFLMGSLGVQADVYMKQKRHSDAMKIMGQDKPAEDVIEEIWITEKGFRSDSPESSMVMLLDQKKMIMIDHAKKQYMEMPMNMDDMMANATEGKGDQEVAVMKSMMEGMMKMETSVEVTGERKSINGWNCRKYILTLTTFMGPISNEIWATEDLKIDMALYDRYSSAVLSVMPGMQNAMGQMMEEMKKIKGVQVYTIFSQKIMNQKVTTTTELLEFKQGKAPSGLFVIPSGYKKKRVEQM